MKVLRSWLVWGGVFALALVIACLIPSPAHAGFDQTTLVHGLPMLGAIGAIRIWGQPLDLPGLQRLATPGPGDLESYPDIKYDRQTFPQAGGVARLAFYTAVGAQNVTNMEAAGQFPAPQWFQLFQVCVTPMAAGPSNITTPASGTNQTGILNDWDLLTKTQGAILNLAIAKKQYGPWPLLAHHGLGGGASGFITQAAATTGQQTVSNGPADGGFGPQGEIIIPPNVGFTVSIDLTAAQALTVATLVEVAFVGRIYRAPR